MINQDEKVVEVDIQEEFASLEIDYQVKMDPKNCKREDSPISTMSLEDMVRAITPPSDMAHPELPDMVVIEEREAANMKTGHVDCLTGEQEQKLMELWALIIELLSFIDDEALKRSIEKKSDKRKQKQLIETLSKNASTHSVDSISSSSSDRSQAMSGHPLSEEFWRQLATDDPDVLLLRFLRARKWSVPDAFFMFFDAMKWRRSFGVHNLLMRGDERAIKKELLNSGKGYFYGYDKEGRLIVLLPAKLHNRYAQTLEENMAHTVLLMETGRRCMRPGVETVTLVFDLADAPMSSFDPGSMQFMIECFQSYYPESLGRCYVVNAPWIFWGFWRIIKPWLDPVVAAKIFFLEDPKQELKRFIPEEMLQGEYGGSSEYKFKYFPPEEKDYPKPIEMKDRQVIEEHLSAEKTKLIDATLHLHSLLNHGHRLFDEVRPVLDAKELAEKWRAERKMIIVKVRSLLQILDESDVPPHMYRRLGLMKGDGSINWAKLADLSH